MPPTVSSTNPSSNGAGVALNVQVAATFGANSHFEGIILCQTAVTPQTGASMNGRALSQTQVALQPATVTQPAQYSRQSNG